MRHVDNNRPAPAPGTATATVPWSAVLWGLAAAVLMPVSAFAAAPGGEHGHVSIGSLFWPTLSFLLYAALMVYGYRRLARPVLRDRSMQIAANIGRARQHLDAAESELEALTEQLAAIDEEKTELKAQLDREGENIAATLIANAEKAALAMQGDTARRIESEYAKASAELRSEVVTAAARAARERLERELTGDDDRRLRQEAVRSLLS